ncbi:hypothetical protein [Nonomuraea sp. NPDC050643]|uniref:hypothetical protein n=1 Tax=Nonomuraea sp. NPDC050643 TaxID=3155660 RepID=UPI0033EE2AB9
MDDSAFDAEMRTAQQLSVLSVTYPGWDIGIAHDESGLLWWATLRRPVTERMRASGVAEWVRQPDAIALAATLAWQTSLVHNARASEFWVPR